MDASTRVDVRMLVDGWTRAAVATRVGVATRAAVVKRAAKGVAKGATAAVPPRAAGAAADPRTLDRHLLKNEE